jgi:glutathione S-transferase
MFPDNHPELFPYVLLAMTIIAFQCFMIPFVYTVRVRAKTFTKEFMQQFWPEHKEAFPEDTLEKFEKTIGFPDMGSGYFSKKLEYKDWYNFNNAQRVHYNYLENLQLILILIFIAGLKQPLAALILSCIYFVFRFVYSFGYGIGGPNARMYGGLVCGLSLITLFGLSLYTVSEFMKSYNAPTMMNRQ